MKLDRIVPFGRSLDEYQKMFALSPNDLSQKILGVADGPASFNAEGTKQGYQIVSIDPIYQFSGKAIEQRFNAVVDNVIGQIIATPDNWVWSYHQNPQDLKASRIKTIETFLADYDCGKQENRYLTQELPNLAFANNSYDLALCSHFLFLYSEQLDLNFHLAAIAEILRVSREVRIFPLLTLKQIKSPYLDKAIAHFKDLGYLAEIVFVAYELQPGANQMLIIHEP